MENLVNVSFHDLKGNRKIIFEIKQDDEALDISDVKIIPPPVSADEEVGLIGMLSTIFMESLHNYGKITEE